MKNIYLKGYGGDNKSHILKIPKNCSIFQLKEQVFEKFGICSTLQRLNFRGKELSNDKFISNYGIDDYDSIDILFRLRGGMKMKVMVKTLSGSSLIYECMPTETVFQLKCQVFNQTGIPVFLQRFIFKSQELQDSFRLNKYGINNEDVIYLVFNMNEVNNVNPQLYQQQQEGKKKRRGTYAKRACTNCRKAHAQCDDSRPCRRCRELGIGDTCQDAPLKRKKNKKKDDDDDENEQQIKNEPQQNSMMNPQVPKIPLNLSNQQLQQLQQLQLQQQQQQQQQQPFVPPFQQPQTPQIKREIDEFDEFDDDDDEFPAFNNSDSLLSASWKSNYLDGDVLDDEYEYDNILSPSEIPSSKLSPSMTNHRNNSIPASSMNPNLLNRGNNNNNNNNMINGPNNINNPNMMNNNQNVSNMLNIDPRLLKFVDGNNQFQNLEEMFKVLVGTIVTQAKEIRELKSCVSSLQRRVAINEGKQMQRNTGASSISSDFGLF